MAFGIDGVYMSDVVVGSLSIPFTHGNSVMWQVENVRQFLPSFMIQVIDPKGTLSSNNALGDGVPISVKMGQQQSDMNQPYANFYCIGAPKVVSGSNGLITTIRCVSPLINYINSIPMKSFKGNSSDVMKQVASDCGFNYTDIDDTNDSQTWISQNKKYAPFAETVAAHGYVNSSSCMVLGVTADQTLHYKNIAALTTKSPKLEIFIGTNSQNAVPAYAAYDYKIVAYADVFNTIKGYNSSAFNWNLDGSTTRTDKVGVTKISKNFEMSNVIKGYVNTGFGNLLPFDVGNTHANYLNAEHQNERNLAQWSSVIHVACNMVVPVNLFDIVQFTINDQGAQPAINPARTGKYMVAAKSKYIGNSYVQKMVLVGQGRNSDNTQPEVSSS